MTNYDFGARYQLLGKSATFSQESQGKKLEMLKKYVK